MMNDPEQRQIEPVSDADSYWRGWNDACDAMCDLSLWKRAFAELKRPTEARICDACKETTMERAELGIDGNCGFALLGENLQEGEAEFEEIRATELNPDPTSDGAKKQAISRAFARLKARLPGREFSYYLGPSHPDYC